MKNLKYQQKPVSICSRLVVVENSTQQAI